MGADQKLFCVIGATGQQGGAVARSLVRQGQKVRTLVRQAAQHAPKTENIRKLGIEVMLGDMTDMGSLDQAVAGADGVFAMTTFFEAGLEAEVQQGMTIVEVAKTAKVSHLVYSSVGGANQNTGIPHFETKWKVEQQIRQLGLPATILRPTFFMDNFATIFREGITKGTLSLPLRPDTRLQMVAVKDIGAFGAAALLNPNKFIGEAIELAGDNLTMPEVAKHFSNALGRPVQFQPMPDDQAESAMGYDMATMFRWFNIVGYGANIADLQQRFQIPLTSLTDFIAQSRRATG